MTAAREPPIGRGWAGLGAALGLALGQAPARPASQLQLPGSVLQGPEIAPLSACQA